MAEYDLDLEEDVQERPFNKEHFMRIMSYALPHRKTLFTGAMLTLATIAINLAEPLLFRQALDKGVARTTYGLLLRLLEYFCACALSTSCVHDIKSGSLITWVSKYCMN